MTLPIVSEGAEILARYGLEPQPPEVIDSSMLRDYVDCPSKFYLRHVLGLKKKYMDPTGAAALDWGSCWHEVMFAFMQALGGTKDERILAGLTALEESYPAYLVPENDRLKRSKERMAEQFFVYVERWLPKESEYIILRNEQYFNVYDPDYNLHWCGRLDSIRRVIRNRKIRVWDYKTTGAMGDTYFDQFDLGFQFPGYVWGSQRFMTEEIWEITVDVMYTVSPGSKKAEGGFDFFERTFRYDDARLHEWATNVKMWVDEIMFHLENYLYQPEKWKKNWNDCTRYGRCQYFDIHSLNPRGEGRMLSLRDDYRVDRWDPSDVGDDD